MTTGLTKAVLDDGLNKGTFVKARSIVFACGFVGISGVSNRLRSFSDTQEASTGTCW